MAGFDDDDRQDLGRHLQRNLFGPALGDDVRRRVFAVEGERLVHFDRIAGRADRRRAGGHDDLFDAAFLGGDERLARPHDGRVENLRRPAVPDLELGGHVKECVAARERAVHRVADGHVSLDDFEVRRIDARQRPARGARTGQHFDALPLSDELLRSSRDPTKPVPPVTKTCGNGIVRKSRKPPIPRRAE